MWRTDPPDLAISAVLFLVLLGALTLGGWLVALLAACALNWRARRRRVA